MKKNYQSPNVKVLELGDNAPLLQASNPGTGGPDTPSTGKARGHDWEEDF